jgi:hypothetical protein
MVANYRQWKSYCHSPPTVFVLVLVPRNTYNCSKKITTSDNLYGSDYTPKWYLRATPIKRVVPFPFKTKGILVTALPQVAIVPGPTSLPGALIVCTRPS